MDNDAANELQRIETRLEQIDSEKRALLARKQKLRTEQQKAVNKMIKHDVGVLHAPTAFGKTVAAVTTLILVHSRQLLDQWILPSNS